LAGDEDWNAVMIRGLYRGQAPESDALDHSASQLRLFWSRLEQAKDASLAAGE
jgi:hypothetical protein